MIIKLFKVSYRYTYTSTANHRTSPAF